MIYVIASDFLKPFIHIQPPRMNSNSIHHPSGTGRQVSVPQELLDAINVRFHLPIITFTKALSNTDSALNPSIVDGQGVGYEPHSPASTHPYPWCRHGWCHPKRCKSYQHCKHGVGIHIFLQTNPHVGEWKRIFNLGRPTRQSDFPQSWVFLGRMASAYYFQSKQSKCGCGWPTTTLLWGKQ